MPLDQLPALDPADGEVVDAEVSVTDDCLVKAFALGPGAALSTHDHPDSTNAFHVVSGEVVVVQGDSEETVAAPGVVVHDRGVPHGARNETEDPAILTATLAPFPG
jgi:quercetin dioxygenase-like cupin family protein